MPELGTIEKVLGNHLYQVSLPKQSACSGCCSGCSETKPKLLTAWSEKQYHVGQQVIIEINKFSVLGLIFFSYLLPLILFISTTLLVEVFFSENLAVLAGLLSMTAGLLLTKKFKKQEPYPIKDS